MLEGASRAVMGCDVNCESQLTIFQCGFLTDLVPGL